MTEPARIVQKVLVSLLERIQDRILDSPESTPSEVSELWLAVRRADSKEFLETLRQDPEIANLRLAADVEAERRRAVELASSVDEQSRVNRELAQRLLDITNESDQLARTIRALGEELSKAKESLAVLALERDKTQAEQDGLKAEMESLTARIGGLTAQDTERLEREATNRARLEAEIAALKREQAENKGEETFQDLVRLVLNPEWIARYSEEGTLHDHMKDVVQLLKKFFLQEKGRVQLRQGLEGGLAVEQREFVEADRIQLRDKGYPKFVNRRDLVRRLRPADAVTVEGLLKYRREWDRKLAGKAVRQEILDRLFAGISAWKGNANINDLSALSKASGVDRGTLRKYHSLGIIDLSWCADIANNRVEGPSAKKRRTVGQNSLPGSTRSRGPGKVAKHRQTRE